ncbi:MAG: hypothetical protein HAW66_04940 [Shewanella sp.]|nr:hypothetical protein [Shewanella sp.]
MSLVQSLIGTVRDAMTSITGSEQSNASKKTEMGCFTDGDKSFSVNGAEGEQANGAFFFTDEGITSRLRNFSITRGKTQKV